MGGKGVVEVSGAGAGEWDGVVVVEKGVWGIGLGGRVYIFILIILINNNLVIRGIHLNLLIS